MNTATTTACPHCGQPISPAFDARRYGTPRPVHRTVTQAAICAMNYNPEVAR